jgi:hypothetical protein
MGIKEQNHHIEILHRFFMRFMQKKKRRRRRRRREGVHQ